jgi:hypothetical protein
MHPVSGRSPHPSVEGSKAIGVTTVPNAEQRAMEALTKLNSIGFPEFTAKLIGEKLS